MRYVFSLPFPGSGMTQLGIPKDAVDQLAAFSIKVPRKNKERIAVYASEGTQWQLAVDFVTKNDPRIMRVVPHDDRFDFCSLTGELIVSRQRTDAT